MLRISEYNQDKIIAITPYNSDFVSGAKSIGGKWNSEKKGWIFDSKNINVLRDLMVKCYGESDIQSVEKVSVKVTVNSELVGYRSGIEVFGQTVALAFGRDSGAKVGTAVYLEGKPRSGGSVKNWCTVVLEGCVFVLHNVPVNKIASTNDHWGDKISVEVLKDEVPTIKTPTPIDLLKTIHNSADFQLLSDDIKKQIVQLVS